MKQALFVIIFLGSIFICFADVVADEPVPSLEDERGFGYYAIILAVLALLSFLALFLWRRKKK
jgi:LPXTG-motif cell wall-anchored protein